MSTSWADIQKQLDPNISQNDYDKIQLQYFQKNIAPHVREGYSVQDTWDLFRENHPRPGAMAEKIGHVIGGLAVQGIELAALTAVTGPLSAGLAETLFGGGRLASAASAIGRGGLAFAAYDALQAKDGDRVNAGVKGALTGALWEVGAGTLLGGFGPSERAAQKVAQEALHEKLPGPSVKPSVTKEVSGLPVIQEQDLEALRKQPPLPSLETPPTPLDAPKAVAEGLQQSVTQAKKLGYTKGPMVETPAKKGLRAVITNAAGQSATINIARGNESIAVGQIKEILDQGGALDHVEYHPTSRSRAAELMSHFADEAENREPSIRLRTTEGDPISVVVPEQAEPTAETVKPPEVTDTISKPMLEIGEIRNRVILSGGQRGPTVPRAEHARMHTLAGDVGQQLGLTRSQVGQLSLRYFNHVSTAGESAESALKFVEPYIGAGEKFGVVPGERPPAGFEEESRFPGFLKPTPGESVRLDLSTGELRNRTTGRILVLPQTSEELRFSGAQIRTPEGPLVVLAKNYTRNDIAHEKFHDGLDHSGLANRVHELVGPHSGTASDIAKGLKSKFAAYGDHSGPQMANEAWTHGATAVREGDTAALEELARMDKSVAHVKAFVGDTAKNLLEESKTQDSAPIRAFQRRLNDLIRRTSPDIADELDKAQLHGWNTWFDPELGKWVQRDGEGREVHASSLDDVWNRIHNSDASAHFPDVAAPMYFNATGPVGEFVPAGSEPVPGTGTPEALPRIPMGLTALSHIWKPAMAWASDVQKVLDRSVNRFLPEAEKIKFFGPMRSMELKAREAAGVMAADRLLLHDTILKGMTDKRKELGEILSRPRDTWGAHMDAVDLTGGHLARLEQLAEWDSARVAKGQTSLLDTLSTLRQVREAGGDLGRVSGDKAVMDALRNSDLSHTDLDVVKVSEWVMGNDYKKAFADDMRDVLNLKKRFANNQDLTWPLQNFVNFTMGVPDKSQAMMNSFAEGWQNNVFERINTMNKSLPKALQIPNINLGKDFWSTYRTILYTSGLGLRPAVAIRDMYQSMFGLVTIGPRAFAEGMARAMTKEGRAEAAAAGAKLHGRNIGQFYGDITGEIPTGGKIHDAINRMADILMAPSRMGHNFGRIITYLGEKGQAEREIAAFRASAMDEASIKRLVNRTSAGFHELPERDRLIALASDPTVSASEAAKAWALSAVEASQFGGTSGTALRTGMGRLFGQYASWPLNHLEFTRKLGARALDNPQWGVPALGMWAGINYGAFKAAESVGIDAKKWLFMSPAGWAGSPTLDFVQNLWKAPEESDAGRKARHDILMFPTELLPTSVELKHVYHAWDTGDWNPVTIFGFNNLKEPKQERDLEDSFWYELGFRKPPL